MLRYLAVVRANFAVGNVAFDLPGLWVEVFFISSGWRQHNGRQWRQGDS